MSVKYLTQN